MTPAGEIVALLTAQPMTAIGLTAISEYQYEMLMLRVRAELQRIAQQKGPQRDDL